jgi:hypothetical protein
MPIFLTKSVVVPQTLSVKTNQNTMVLSTTDTTSTLSGTGLTIGNVGVNVGTTGYTTNLVGNVQVNGSAGATGQFLTSNGTSAGWQSIVPNLRLVLSLGNNADNGGIFDCSFINANGVLTLGGGATTRTVIGQSGYTTNIQGNVRINGSAGSSGQVLTSNGTTAVWRDASSAGVSSLASVLATGASANNVPITNLPSVDASGILSIGCGLSTTNTVIGRTGNPVDVNGNVRINGSAGSTGQVLTSNGTTAVWTDASSAGVSSLASVLATGASANNVPITNLPSVDASGILSIGCGISTTNTVIGRTGNPVDVNGNVRINGSAGSTGQVLTSDGTTPYWSAVPSSSLRSVLETGADANHTSIYNLNSIDSSYGLAVGSFTALGVQIGRPTQTVSINGNFNIANTAPLNGGLLVGNGTTAAFQTDIITNGLYFSPNGRLASSTIQLDTSNNCVKVGNDTLNCALGKSSMVMIDASFQHSVAWSQSNLLQFIPNSTAQLVNKWQSHTNSQKVNLCGYQSSFVVDTSGDVQQPDHSTMNNNYVLWLKPSGSEPRTLILFPLNNEYVNNLRFTLRNDSGAPVTIVSSNDIYGNTTVATGTTNPFAAISYGGVYAWIV